MKLKYITSGLLLACASSFSWGQSVEQERAGIDLSVATTLPPPSAAAHNRALAALPDTGLLLVPESTNDRVMAFDPVTGNLIDADFIPADPTNLSTPIHAILSADGNSVLVSDQLDDVVQQYGLDGTYIGIFAPAGGVDNTILDNLRGISLDPANGNLLVSVGGGANDDSIAEFDTAGNFVGNRVANGAGGLDSPFDVLVRNNSLFVGGINSDLIHTYDLAGTSTGSFAPIDTFPEQLAPSSTGGLLVANFSGAQEGIVEYDAAGAVLGVYNPPSLGGYRGVYELPNGNLLVTNGGGVHEIDRAGVLIETKIAGVSGRFIEFVGPAAAPLPDPVEVPSLNLNGLITLMLALLAMAGLVQRRRQND